MWFILLTGLLAQGLATQVSFQSSSSAASSSEQKTEWSWQEPTAAGNSPQDSFRPLSFSSGDTQPDLLSDNTQDGSSESAYSSENAVVENILQSSRQGRNIAGYDDLYSDPDVKTVLQAGNDTIARAFIKDKLCSLGLMNCDDSEGRRPFYSPHRDIHPQEVIYAQPVTIKPVGRPLPAIPVKKPFVYGPPKPVPIPSFGSGLPVYGPPSSGHYSGPRPPFSGPPPSFSGPYPGYKKPSISSGPRPIYEDTGLDGEYDFVPENNNEFIEKKQVIVQPSSGLQQHVHHHYHHTDGNKPSSIVGPSAIAGNGLTGNGYGYGSGSYGNSYNDFDEYKKAFKIKSPSSGNSLDPVAASGNSYANRYPVYEKPKRDSFFNGKEGGKVVNSGFTGSQFGASNFGSNNFGTNSFGAGNNGFKNNLGASNGLNNNFGTNNFGAGNNGFNNNLGGSNGFNNNFGSNSFNNGFGSNNYDDCVCVPYDQCAAIDQAGRKDDLFLAIDPRNIGKNIDAETEDIVVTDANGTMSVIRVPKEVNATEQVQHTKEQKNSSDKKVDDADKNKSGEEIKRSKREAKAQPKNDDTQGRQFGRPPVCGPRHVCCRKNQIRPGNNRPQYGQCGVRNGQGINGRIKTPVYVDGDSEFGEYPWQVAILKKDPSESVYVCGGTLISPRHILTAAHCVKTHLGHDLRARLGEWDVNHDVEFYPYIERDIVSINVHPEFYAGTLYNDIAILKLDHDVDFEKNPHISPACLPNPHDDFTGTRCWTTGWGKDAFGDFGKYQNILKEVDVPIVSNAVCENQMKRTRLGPSFNLHSGFICAGGEEGKDACKGDGGGPMVCERQGIWHLAGVVSWGIGCGQPGVPGVYTRVSHYLDWIRQNSY
ncbi:uncharacterized protein LOC123268853 isoform X2 [Cotesia glomerata]|uniref:uncharacterized protein LOC123268853 isoform X2 n=1 Tax=Cotesia glomerata TaxID=32391 RepID=UPI001D01C0A3|nr:uncharacterized protein LOC123268853 isoform X2 [Cotesia glomerata]